VNDHGYERTVRLERDRRRLARHHQAVAQSVRLGRRTEWHQPFETVLRSRLRHLHVPDHGQHVRDAGQ